jgi:hypothetical protein
VPRPAAHDAIIRIQPEILVLALVLEARLYTIAGFSSAHHCRDLAPDSRCAQPTDGRRKNGFKKFGRSDRRPGG